MDEEWRGGLVEEGVEEGSKIVILLSTSSSYFHEFYVLAYFLELWHSRSLGSVLISDCLQFKRYIRCGNTILLQYILSCVSSASEIL